MQSAQRVLLVLFAGPLQVTPAQTIAPPLPTPATEVMHPSPPTRSANGPGAPNWTVVGAGRGSSDLRAATGMNAPVGQNGDFLIGPDYRPAPELNVARHSPKGTVRQFTLESRDRMAAVLKDKGYQYQYVFTQDSGHCDRRVRDQTVPQALEWVWRGYEPERQ
jgi:hypothetical protein